MCTNLQILMTAIIERYFIDSYCLSFITEEKLNFIDVLNDVPYLYHTFDKNDDNSSLSTFLHLSLAYGCLNYVICVQNPEAFLEVYEDKVHKSEQRNGNRKLIFLPVDCSINTKQALEDFLQTKFIRFYPNILLILPANADGDEDCNIMDLVTHKYVGESDNNEILILDKWNHTNDTFETGANLFPDKIRNMEGRILKVSTFTYKPYAVVVVDDSQTVVELHGTELKVVVEFCILHNCTVEMVLDDDQWGEINPNMTGIGLLGNLGLDISDIALGGCFQWYKEYTLLDFSNVVIRSGITCLAPAPLPKPPYLLPILPFSAEMWFCIVGSILYTSTVLYFAKKATGKPHSSIQTVLNVVSIMISQSPSNKKLRGVMRYLTNILCLFAVILSSAYSCGLARSMTVQEFGKRIDSVKDLIESNLNWGATQDSWIFSLRNAENPDMIHIYNKFREHTEEELEKKQTTRDFAFAVERMPAGFFALGDYITDKALKHMKLMTEDLYFEYSVILGRTSSPFIPKLNRLIGLLHQSGLLNAWEVQVITRHSNFRVQLGVKKSQGKEPRSSTPHVIGLFHILGPLLFLIFGYTVATLVFVGEIFRKTSTTSSMIQLRNISKTRTKPKRKDALVEISKETLDELYRVYFREFHGLRHKSLIRNDSVGKVFNLFDNRRKLKKRSRSN